MNKLTVLGAGLLLTFAGAASAATVYNDTTGDVAVPGNPFPHIDITSVEVSNTPTDLIFKINLNGDPIATDWGNYMVGMDTVLGGDAAGNGWNRPIGMSSGMDYWLGGWANSGNGAELRNWTGASWNLQAASYNANLPALTKDASSVTMSVPLSYMSLVHGSVVAFDVYTSGGGSGDGAVDALSSNPNPAIANWGDYYNSGNNVLFYTVVIPEPSSLALLALGGLLAARRRR